jgi:hypothetical protein
MGSWFSLTYVSRSCRGASRIGACLATLLIAGLFATTALTDSRVPSAACGIQPHGICENKSENRNKNKDQPKQRDPSDAKAQQALLTKVVARLAPQRKRTVDLYTIGVAGWADQDVFIKELDGAVGSLGKVLPVTGRVLPLINRRESIYETPLATRSNLAAAVRAVAQIMDPSEDVLILLMTSHGTRGGFGLQLPGRPFVELPAPEVAKMLDDAGIWHRLVIVSACYSGAFVPPLANDNTIVMTAADANSSSFGCAPGRDWTFFGDALFNRSLRPGVDLQSAFNQARLTISEWELMERFPPSNPQAHFGPALVERLAPIIAASARAAR